MQLTIIVLITNFYLTFSFMYIHPRVYSQVQKLFSNDISTEEPDEFDELLKTYKYEPFKFGQSSNELDEFNELVKKYNYEPFPFVESSNETEINEEFFMQLNLTELMENIKNLTDDNHFDDIIIKYL